MPLILLFAVSLVVSLSGRADAAPVFPDPVPLRSVCAASPQIVEGGCILDAGARRPDRFALSDLDLIGRGGDLLASAASSALRITGTIAPVPLPAAGWLLAMGLGGLGLFGKRRRDALPGLRDGAGIEPLGSALRNSVRTEAADHRRAPVRLDGFRRLIDAFRDSCLNATRPHAFAPGQSSPRRPVGGAGTLWAATAKRGPPDGDADMRAGGVFPAPAGAFAHIENFALTRMKARSSGLLARFFCALRATFSVPDPTPVRVGPRPARDNKNGSNPHHAPRPLTLVRETSLDADRNATESEDGRKSEMFDFSRKHLLGALGAAAMVVGMAGSASAAPVFGIAGGTAGTISTPSNQGVFPVYSVNSADGFYGSNLSVSGGPSNILVEFLGSEADYDNSFTFSTASFNTGGGTASSTVWTAGTDPAQSVFPVLDGAVSFLFSSSGNAFTGTNGSDNVFFSFLNTTATSGTVIDLWFDDSNGADDNHDDMVIRMTVSAVPLPAAGLLLLGGLGGLGFMSRKRKAA